MKERIVHILWDVRRMAWNRLWTNDLLLKITNVVTVKLCPCLLKVPPSGAAVGFGLEAGGPDLGRWPCQDCAASRLRKVRVWLFVAVSSADPNLWTRQVLLGVFLTFNPFSGFMSINSSAVGNCIFPTEWATLSSPTHPLNPLSAVAGCHLWPSLHSERQVCAPPLTVSTWLPRRGFRG